MFLHCIPFFSLYFIVVCFVWWLDEFFFLLFSALLLLHVCFYRMNVCVCVYVFFFGWVLFRTVFISLICIVKCVTFSLLHCTHCTRFRNIISVKCEFLQPFCSFLICIVFYFENIGTYIHTLRLFMFSCFQATSLCLQCMCVSCLPYKYVCWISV